MKKDELKEFLTQLNLEVDEDKLEKLFDFTNKKFNTILNTKIKLTKEDVEKESQSQFLKQLGFDDFETINQKLILANETEKLKTELENTNLLFQLSKIGVDENLSKLVLEGIKKEIAPIENFDEKLLKINELVSPLIKKSDDKLEKIIEKSTSSKIEEIAPSIDFLQKTQATAPTSQNLDEDIVAEFKKQILK